MKTISVCAHHTPATGGEETVMKTISVCAHHTPATGGEETVMKPISVCAHHTPATGGEERESHRANKVYALTTHQLQVERRQ